MLPAFDEIRERIVRLRKEAGMTQAELAEQADVSQSFIAKLERGQSTPNYEAVSRVYNTLENVTREQEQTAVELMTTYVVSLSPDDTVRYASSIMKTENYSQLPVLKGGKCIGTVTTMAILEADCDDNVRAHMGEPLPEVPGNTSRTAISELLKTSNAVLVQNKSKGIAGIITASDVI